MSHECNKCGKPKIHVGDFAPPMCECKMKKETSNSVNDWTISFLKGAIEEKNARIMGLESSLLDRNHLISDLRKQIKELEKENKDWRQGAFPDAPVNLIKRIKELEETVGEARKILYGISIGAPEGPVYCPEDDCLKSQFSGQASRWCSKWGKG